MRRSIIPAGLALVALALAAAADEPANPSAAPDAANLFADLDTNGDGLLTADEVPEDHRRLFERLVRKADANNDSKLTADEFATGLRGAAERNAPAQRDAKPSDDAKPQSNPRPARNERPMPGRFFERLDANSDGKVTLDEVPEERRAGFNRLIERGDKDGDGALTRQEFARAFGDSAAGRQRSKSKDGASKDGRRPDQRPEPARFFERLDADKDGKVTLAEVPEPMRERLEPMLRRADKDGDGAVTLDEFRSVGRAGRAEPSAKGPGDAGPESGSQPPQRRRGAERGNIRGGLFQALDTDRDGQLSEKEISAASDILRGLDSDGDGQVSLRETFAARVQQE